MKLFISPTDATTNIPAYITRQDIWEAMINHTHLEDLKQYIMEGLLSSEAGV